MSLDRTLEVPTPRQMRALTHAVLDADSSLLQDEGELIERVKAGCARATWLYDGTGVRKAVDATLFVRRVRAR